MTEADELFSQAYGLAVVDERPREAIDLCRKALEIAPDHYRGLVFLGMLLDDQGNEAENLESRQQFVEAIKRAKSLPPCAIRDMKNRLCIISVFGNGTAETLRTPVFSFWRMLSYVGARNRMNIWSSGWSHQ